ncbi:mitochondrial assembly of ribosomal large subunit protein 1 [Spea bombifrons]|uniref:mitochondrial assembly of ribosomal large subunit protein 1 n=1 Tax=Spea bombifrons TaxID=233779 RepID=UPI002349FE13|nr:mitochondrial assembly of ribosomal large subunit protein 1 [Spea bombifrons]
MWVRWLRRVHSVHVARSSSFLTFAQLRQLTYRGFVHCRTEARIRGVPAAMTTRVSQLCFQRELNCVTTERVGSSHEAPLPSRASDGTYTEEGKSIQNEKRGAALPSFGIHVLVSLLREENAKDMCVIKLPPEMKYVDYFVVVSGTSTRHIQAMAQYSLKVFKSLKRVKDSHVVIEGKETEDWMCIDFGNIVVHFMLPETRELYELEKLWTLRSYDDQLSQMAAEVLPLDFTFGLHSPKE